MAGGRSGAALCGACEPPRPKSALPLSSRGQPGRQTAGRERSGSSFDTCHAVSARRKKHLCTNIQQCPWIDMTVYLQCMATTGPCWMLQCTGALHNCQNASIELQSKLTDTSTKIVGLLLYQQRPPESPFWFLWVVVPPECIELMHLLH